MKFEMGETVAAVYRSKFYDNIRKGDFVLCKIYEIVPYTNGTNFLYRAKDEEGNIFAGFENNVSMSPTELISIDYLLETLTRYKKEALCEAGYLEFKIKEVMNAAAKSEESNGG